MKTKDTKTNINLGAVVRQMLQKKRLLVRNVIIAGVVAAALIVAVPRYYVCEVALAPEFGNAASAGSLASLAGSLGINVSAGAGDDAISPSLYPDLMQSKAFLVSLFPVQITTQDSTLHTDYYTYLTKYQKKPWWQQATKWAKRSIKNLFVKPKPKQKSNYRHLNPFDLSEEDYNLAEGISNRINCSVDRRNYVITIRITDQDPLVSACIADTVRDRLQQFIIKYRTSKARVDVAYYEKLLREARQDYQKATQAYSAYADSHRDMIMQSYISERDQLESDMQNAFTIYTAMNQQLQSAKAKVQESTPAFTTLKCASVPVRPAGPKRVVFVLTMMVMVFLATGFWIVKGNSIKRLFGRGQTKADDNSAAPQTVAGLQKAPATLQTVAGPQKAPATVVEKKQEEKPKP